MKIIQIMPEFGLAGAETMCENLSYELVRQGEDVIVISLYEYHSAITERLELNGIKMIYLNKKPGLDLSMITKLINIFKQERPDVIHTHRYVMQYAIPAAIFAGVNRRVHTVHNIAKKENTRIARKVNYLFFKLAHVIPVALSEEIQSTIAEEYHLKKERIPIILNGINLSKSITKKSYDFGSVINILHIGRFSTQKNHVGLIEAIETVNKSFPCTRLQLIGEGELKNEIINMVQERKLANVVDFIGVQDNVFPFLGQADIFVLPSNYEGIPMTLIEAMATGLPIVATKVGGVPDMLEDKKEALIVENNKDSLVNAIEQLLKDKELRFEFGSNAIKKSELFSSAVMARKYIDVYQNS